MRAILDGLRLIGFEQEAVEVEEHWEDLISPWEFHLSRNINDASPDTF
jgi:hypothetical protein